jgi:aldehyde dehydrogenase (NAD+)
VVAAIIAYNYPNQLALAKLAPALAAGCTVVLKGAPDTPWTTLALGRLIAEHTDIPPAWSTCSSRPTRRWASC